MPDVFARVLRLDLAQALLILKDPLSLYRTCMTVIGMF